MSTHRANSNQSCFQQESANLVTTSDSYYVELPLEALDDQGSLLDSLIHYSFDTLNVQCLDLRIVAETRRVIDTSYAMPHSNAFSPAAAWYFSLYLYAQGAPGFLPS
jgi:hypothetical protein